MGYSDGSALLLARIHELSSFNEFNAAEEDWGILNSGAAEVYAILRPGEHTTEPASIGQRTVHTTWNCIVELWTLYDAVATPAALLKEAIDDIIVKIAQYPHLGDSSQVLYATTYTGGEMQERWTSEGGPKWAVWEVIVAWLQERTVTPAE